MGEPGGRGKEKREEVGEVKLRLQGALELGFCLGSVAYGSWAVHLEGSQLSRYLTAQGHLSAQGQVLGEGCRCVGPYTCT